MPVQAQEVLKPQAQTQTQTYDQFLQSLREHRRPATELTKQELVNQAWDLGKRLEEDSAAHSLWSDYNGYINPKLAKDLEMDAGELQDMRRFVRWYPAGAPIRDLNWADYTAVLRLDDPSQRDVVLDRIEKEKWSILRLREELKKIPREKPPVSPVILGKLNLYRVIKTESGLTLDLGFGNYFKASESEKFKEGDILSVKPDGTLSLESPTAALYSYSAVITQVVDGDTLEALVDLGFGLTTRQKFRLNGIDAPEMNTPEGVAAKQFVYDKITKHGPQVIIRVAGLDKYNRYLADVWVGEAYLNKEILDSGMALKSE